MLAKVKMIDWDILKKLFIAHEKQFYSKILWSKHFCNLLKSMQFIICFLIQSHCFRMEFWAACNQMKSQI